MCLVVKHGLTFLDEKRKALQPKSEKCIFVGYFEDVKGYRLLQPHSNEIIIRRDVKFDEGLLATMSLIQHLCHLWPMKPSLMKCAIFYSIPNFSTSAPILVSSSR
jgi:hypothetical protein